MSLGTVEGFFSLEVLPTEQSPDYQRMACWPEPLGVDDLNEPGGWWEYEGEGASEMVSRCLHVSSKGL